jgi:NADH:ubiquinone oxidoreductase subunit H
MARIMKSIQAKWHSKKMAAIFAFREGVGKSGSGALQPINEMLKLSSPRNIWAMCWGNEFPSR